MTDTEDNAALVIDPGSPSEKLQKRIDDFGAEKLQYILLTHGHYDHIGNAAALKARYPHAVIVIGEKDAAFTHNDALNLSLFRPNKVTHFDADKTVKDGYVLAFGKDSIEVLATPGHTAGSVCYLLGGNLYTGDTIMKRTTGRTDFPTGNSRDMFDSVQRIAALEGNLHLYCGHGEDSSLDFERANNIFMGNVFYDDLY